MSVQSSGLHHVLSRNSSYYYSSRNSWAKPSTTCCHHQCGYFTQCKIIIIVNIITTFIECTNSIKLESEALV